MTEPGEPTGTIEDRLGDLGGFIRDQRRNARMSLRKLSERAGISNPYLSQIERGLRKPSAEILQAIAKGLRISAETLYVRAGFLEDRGEEPDVVAEIRRDPSIGERHKQMLVEIYRSFRSEHAARGDGGPRAAPVVPTEASGATDPSEAEAG
jgi:transcriptional regulator with XRE-family HTH domain